MDVGCSRKGTEGRAIEFVWLDEEKEKNRENQKREGMLLVLTLRRSEFRMDHAGSCHVRIVITYECNYDYRND